MNPRHFSAAALLMSLCFLWTGCAGPRTQRRQPTPVAHSIPRPEGAAMRADGHSGALAANEAATVFRGQNGFPNAPMNAYPGSNEFTRHGERVAQAQPPFPPAGNNPLPGPGALPGPPGSPEYVPFGPSPETIGPGWGGPVATPPIDIDPTFTTPVDVFVEEAQTGRLMFGAGINSDAGLTGQITIEERNFSFRNIPRSWDDIASGRAFRGDGQSFRLEAMPGSIVQRYMVSFSEPYLMDTNFSLSLSGFLFDRFYDDWDEERLGGRVAIGRRLTPALSLSVALSAQQVELSDPRVTGVADLDNALGDNFIASGKLQLSHDTRDIPFAPTQGHLFEVSLEQVFGDYNYSRAELDYRKYFLLFERPDGSGRHTLGHIAQVGFTGSDTPIFENYFAGGQSTLRGFDFRGASPVDSTVKVGGEFRFLGSLEYIFPLTANDMLKGALFVDYGTVEEEIDLVAEDFRVSPGFGIRVSVPALGPAPLAIDLAFPIAREDTDELRTLSIFMGVGR